jgi:hypothetical protein
MVITTDLCKEKKLILGVKKSYFGLYRDSSDSQWESFNDNLILMIILVIGYLVI